MAVKKVIVRIEREFIISDDPYSEMFEDYDEATDTYTQTKKPEEIVQEMLRFFHEDLSQEYLSLRAGDSYPSAEVEIIEE